MEGRLFNMGKEGACKIKKAPLMIKPSKPPQGGEGKTVQSAFARWKCTLLVLRITFLHGKACHWILSRHMAPYSTAITDSLNSQVAAAPLRIQFAGVIPVPLPPPRFGRVIKGKRPYVQVRRLTSPDLRILCRMCTVDNKTFLPDASF